MEQRSKMDIVTANCETEDNSNGKLNQATFKKDGITTFVCGTTQEFLTF
jgi:hypothetical protein